MNVRKRKPIFALFLLAGAVAGLFAVLSLGPTYADDDGGEDNPNPPVRLTIRNGVPTLTITAAEQQNAGIVASRLDPAPSQDYMRGFATVLDPKGLTELQSQYRDAEAQVAVAKARVAGSQSAYRRARILNKDNQNVSTAQLQTAHSTFSVDTDTLAVAETRAAGIIATARQIWGETLAQEIAADRPAITDFVNRRSYLVRVTLPPGVVIATPPAIASALYGPTDVRLHFVSLAATADPKLQGVSYLYETQAKNLLPGLTLDVALAVKAARRGVIVPDSAVIWLEGRAWIYIRTAPTVFIRREIRPDLAGPHGGYIVSGIPPETRVVIRGAQMLLSEEFRASVPVED